MRRFTSFMLALALLPSCTRTFQGQGAPGPGTISGQVVYEKPGSDELVTAAGASVSLLQSSVSAVSGEDGHFVLDGILQTRGSLLIRVDADRDGVYERQRVLRLDEIGAGPGRQIGLGQVVVSRNAALHGRVLLGDLAGAAGGHGGTVVFVPQGPYTAYTNDDGSFYFSGLPAGSISFTAFHPGYDSQAIGDVALRPNEDFSAKEVVLQVKQGASSPGSIAGHVSFQPALASAAGTSIAALSTTGASASASSAADGTFALDGLAEGLYALTVGHAGYTSAVVSNVLVQGQKAVIPEIVLGTSPAPVGIWDGGVGPAPIDEGSGTPVQVISTNAANASGGSPYAVKVIFNEALDFATATDPSRVFAIDASGQPVPATLRYDPTRFTVTLVPDEPFAFFGTYALHVRDVHSAAASHDGMAAPYALPFRTRGPLWDLYTDPSGAASTVDSSAQPYPPNTSTKPGIAAAAGGVFVVSRRIVPDGGCPVPYSDHYGRLYAEDVSSGGELQSLPDTPSGSCELDNYQVGARHMVRAGDRAWTILGDAPWSGTVSGFTGQVVVRREGSRWAEVATTSSSTAVLASDGASVFLIDSDGSNNNLLFSAWNEQSSQFSQPQVIGGAQGAATPLGGGGSDGGFLAAWKIQLPGAAGPGSYSTQVWQRTASGMASAGTVATEDDVGWLRIFTVAGVPVLIQSEQHGGGWSAIAYAGTTTINVDGTPMTSWKPIGGGPAGQAQQLDAAVLGKTLYVALLGTQSVTVRHLPLGTAGGAWVDDPGPQPDGSLSVDLSCVSDGPSVDTSTDALWVAWSEGCGSSPTLWRTWVRQMH